jgi:aryl-alcohol dehydrogenase-like predicted oxidoreductase
MEHRQLGRTGVSVSKFCLGAMMFGAWGNPDHDESIRIIHTAIDAGINFIDTADVYGQGESEVIVGKALAGGRRDDVILATKFHNAWAMTPISRATHAAGSPGRSRTRCGARLDARRRSRDGGMRCRDDLVAAARLGLIQRCVRFL